MEETLEQAHELARTFMKEANPEFADRSLDEFLFIHLHHTPVDMSIKQRQIGHKILDLITLIEEE